MNPKCSDGQNHVGKQDLTWGAWNVWGVVEMIGFFKKNKFALAACDWA